VPAPVDREARLAVQRKPMPDYSKPLQDIAAALSRPTTPAWLMAVASSILGFASAFALQFVQQRLVERSKRERMRRLLYVDLAELFLTVEEIMEFRQMEESDRWRWQKEQLKLFVGFKGEKHLRENEDVYVQLAERPSADYAYVHFHKALDDVDQSWHVNWSVARQVFANAVYDDDLRRTCFRRFVGKACAERLYRRCKAIHERSQKSLNEMESDSKP
jgi:hypothetical protein